MRLSSIQNIEGIDCSAQHTLYQLDRWVCNICGMLVYTETPAHKAEVKCGQLHTHEIVQCSGCGKKWEGWEFASEWEDICS